VAVFDDITDWMLAALVVAGGYVVYRAYEGAKDAASGALDFVEGIPTDLVQGWVSGGEAVDDALGHPIQGMYDAANNALGKGLSNLPTDANGNVIDYTQPYMYGDILGLPNDGSPPPMNMGGA
jgi:hypothetical protein